MKSTMKIGDVGTLSGMVGPGQTITLGGEPEATVYSTPSMINLMEHAAREALRPFLEPGEESVGIDVQVEHLAATPPKTEVTASATIKLIEKNVIGFDLEARDAWEVIGRGTHRRAVIRTEKFSERLARKKTPATSKARPSLEFIDLRREGRLMWATLNRPAKRNVFNEAMTRDLESLVDWLDGAGDQIGVVVLSGAGDTFSAGDDISELRPDDTQAMTALSLRRGAVYRRMTGLPQVLIAAIDGLALGGGFVCACSCDIRVATHNTKLGLPEVTLGWPPNYGIAIVQSVLGRPTALRLALSGKPVGASEAQRFGAVHEIVPAFRLFEEARQIAETILANPPEAVAATKQLFAIWNEEGDEPATRSFIQCLQTNQAQASIHDFKR